jgi:hypothetical protein
MVTLDRGREAPRVKAAPASSLTWVVELLELTVQDIPEILQVATPEHLEQ